MTEPDYKKLLLSVIRELHDEGNHSSKNQMLYDCVSDFDKPKTLQSLLILGANPNYQLYGVPCLVNAIQAENLEAAYKLIKAGADVNVVPVNQREYKDGDNVLMITIKKIQKSTPTQNGYDNDRWFKFIRFLLKNKASVAHKNKHGQSIIEIMKEGHYALREDIQQLFEQPYLDSLVKDQRQPDIISL